ncbi:NUDIX hydrolase [Micromonospora aurantiaca (nom. illeg.)]|uniref:NUDIX hydrolase n=1 Tax=Micromonospora aurantiaca (nom. illeg.) TaxID=47850 RepID=UPI0033CDAA07
MGELMRIVGAPQRLAAVGNTALDRVVATLPTYREPWECGLVRRPAAAAVLPYDLVQGVYLLVRQPRIGTLGELTLEAPAGVLDAPADDPQETAARELQEELGLRAEHWWPVASAVHVSPGYTDERMSLFLCEGLSPVPARPLDAYISPVRFPLAGLAAHLVEYGRAPDADLKTLALLQALQIRVFTG